MRGRSGHHQGDDRDEDRQRAVELREKQGRAEHTRQAGDEGTQGSSKGPAHARQTLERREGFPGTARLVPCRTFVGRRKGALVCWAGMMALAAHIGVAIYGYRASPALAGGEGERPCEEEADSRLPERAELTVPMVPLGDGDPASAIYTTLWLRGMAGCFERGAGPAVADGSELERDWPRGQELDRAGETLRWLATDCVHYAGAYGARASITVNRLAGGGYTAQVVPLNDAARDRDLLCCIKAAQGSVAAALSPGRTRRYTIDSADGVTFSPDPFRR